MLPTPEMDKDGQLPEERRIPSSLRCLKRYPGLSISLEPDPHSGDPEVKITELNTGTPITPISSKNCQRPSLERIGRQLQVTEGLKCALNPFDTVESNDNPGVPNIFEVRDDLVGEMHHADAANCAVITKPFKEFLQRSSLGLHHEDRPVKERFQRPSMGINIGFNHEEKGDLVTAMSLARTGGASGMQMVSIGLNTEEPIRLPREDSFAVLAKAREELANQSIQKATSAEICVGIQTDVTMEDLFHQGDDKNAAGSSHKLNSSVPVEDRKRLLTLETWEASHKVAKSNKLVFDRETSETNARTFAHEPGDDFSKTEVLSQGKHVDGSANLIVDSVLPMCDTQLKADLDDHDFTHGREFGMQQASNLIDQSMLPNNAVKEREEVLADNKRMTNQFSESSVELEVTKELKCTKVLEKEESLLAIPNAVDLPERVEAISSGDLVDHLVVTKLSNREAENDERPLVQREAKIVGLTPALLDLINVQVPQHAETNETLSLLSLHPTNVEPYSLNVIKPCMVWACASSKAASSMQCPTDPLSNFQCCLDVLEMSQEAELLWTEIKNRCYLLALQICLFLFVLFWGGLAEVLVPPPPT